jgi:hypothetical protein
MSKVKHPHEVGIDAATLDRLRMDWREAEKRAERTDIIPDGMNFSQAELRAAFDLVAPFDNWKLPIDAWINPAFLLPCMKAVDHFAGGGLKMIETDPKTGRLHVQAPGYYAIIGA